MSKKLTWVFIITLVTALITNANVSYALSSKKIFVIETIAVDETSNTALKARERALEVGQKIAWKRLLDRLVFSDSVEKLQDIQYSDLRALITGYEVLRERTSTVRYLADLSVTFNPNQVRKFFLDQNIAYAETPSLPMLVIPILITNGVASLWENKNPWRDAWENHTEQKGLLDVRIPIGTLADIRDLTAIQALRGDTTKLKNISDRYKTQNILIARASKRFDLRDNSPILEIILTKFNTDQVEETIIDVIKGEPTDELLALLNMGVKKAVSSISNSWKEENIITSGLLLRVPVLVPINDFRKWISLRSRLNEIGILKHVSIVRISKDEASLVLRITGNIRQLRNALRPENISLLKGPQDWILSDSEMAVPKKYLLNTEKIK